ncbi:MAG: phytanoyl-CoA dioxygenase family protein [Arenicellales bacterium]|nr:phytanoyl-CoA dioxygenase family protein [Arenicellales bacterium]
MGALTEKQIRAFHDQGYLVVENVLDEGVVKAIEDEYSELLDREVTELFQTGRISSTYPHLPFGPRYVAALSEEPALFERVNISLPLYNEDFPADAKVHTGPAVFAMLTDPGLLDCIESLIGPEIQSNPVQHVRIKPPEESVPQSLAELSYVGKTTWHQDMGALMDEADDTEVVTAWVAITTASRDNGCLCAIPGSHKKGELVLHCPGKGIAAENYIPASVLGEAGKKRVVPLPVRRGGVVLLNRYTQHAAFPNKTDQIRWSFDLRYNPAGQPSGRPAFPSFVARSIDDPKSLIRDAAQWTSLWQEAHRRILSGQYEGPIFNADRWSKNADLPICA